MTPREPDYQRDGITLYCGDCLEVLRHLPSESVDAVIADPPYSSGGMTRGDRMQSTAAKYVQTGTEIIRDNFTGDNRDGRGWCYWMALWLSECHRIVRESGYCLTFTDWRQLPLASDAIQSGGFVWRGVVPWNKGEGSRAPHKGYFRHQCEYVVWGTRGVSRPVEHGGPWPGCYDIRVLQSDRHHQTGKPTKLLERLVVVAPPNGLVVDPFMGSGTAAVACIRTGRRFIGVEIHEGYFAQAVWRIEEELKRHPLFDFDAEQTKKTQ